jgi:hypothetical protein
VSEDSASGQPRPLPMTAGALLVNGMIHSHTSLRGDVTPAWHPLIAELLRQLPVETRERYAGWCAEVVLISDRLYEAESGRAKELTAGEARAALWGARITATRIREQGDPAHGTYQPPCRSCAALLEWFGVEAVAT